MMRNWSRREFTRNATMLALFSPYISLLDPKVARAQAGAGQAKYLLIVTSNGTAPEHWAPSGSAGNVVFSEMNETLTPIKNDVILLNNFDSNGSAGSHNAIGSLTGNGSYSNDVMSLDEWVARDLRARGIRTQVPQIHLGGMPQQSGLRFVNNKLEVPTFDLGLAFSNIFDGAAPVVAAPPPATGGGAPVATGPSTETIRLQRRQSILDSIRGEISVLERSLGGLEKEKLQKHSDSLRVLEERIAQQLSIQQGSTGAGVPATGGAPAAPAFITPVSCDRPGNLAAAGGEAVENSAVALSVATAAFACDITRVALVEFGHHQSTPINLPGVVVGDWHNDFMHSDPEPKIKLTAIERWMGDRMVELVGALKNTPAPDGQGSLFDQTYVLWAREMGDAVNHRGDNMPYVVTGRAGGYLRPGNGYINAGGTAHIQILASAAEAMGATNLSTLGGASAPGVKAAFPGLRA
jgi:hypothetical protein